MRCLLLATICAAAATVGCEKTEPSTGNADPSTVLTLSSESVEVGCYGCIYEMSDAEGCELAAVINGTPMRVTGVDLDAHKNGLCSAAKTAVVSGRVDGDNFLATSVQLE